VKGLFFATPQGAVFLTNAFGLRSLIFSLLCHNHNELLIIVKRRAATASRQLKIFLYIRFLFSHQNYRI